MNGESKLSPDALLAALRELPSPAEADPALKQRLYSRVAVSALGLAPAVTTATRPPALGGESTSLVRPVAHTAGAAASNGAARTVALWLAPAFVAGALSGVAIDRWCGARQSSRSAASVPTASPSAAVSAGLVPDPMPAEVSDKATPKAVERNQTASPAGSSLGSVAADPGASLAAERKLLDAARTALARGEPQAGIGALEQHVKRFPKGTLSEEREALYVRVLVAMGDSEAARARAEGFQRRFPSSIFTPVVERALGSIARQNDQVAPKP